MQIRIRSKFCIEFDGQEQELSIPEANGLCRKLMRELGVINFNQLTAWQDEFPEYSHIEKHFDKFKKKWSLEMQIEVESKLYIKFDKCKEDLTISEAKGLCLKLMRELGVENIHQLIPEFELCHPEKD